MGVLLLTKDHGIISFWAVTALCLPCMCSEWRTVCLLASHGLENTLPQHSIIQPQMQLESLLGIPLYCCGLGNYCSVCYSAKQIPWTVLLTWFLFLGEK